MLIKRTYKVAKNPHLTQDKLNLLAQIPDVVTYYVVSIRHNQTTPFASFKILSHDRHLCIGSLFPLTELTADLHRPDVDHIWRA